MRANTSLFAVALVVVTCTRITSGATLAYWHFSETSGNTAADSSGNGYNGTLSPNINTGLLAGDSGSSGWMTGGKLKISDSSSLNNYVDTSMPLQLLSGPNGFTAEAILTWRGTSGENWSPIFGENTSDHNTNGIFFFGKQDGSNAININIAGINSGSTVSGTNLFDGNEHHVALVFDNPNNQTRVYVDYNLLQTFNGISGTPTFSGVNVMRLGGNGHAADERWIGNFNEMRFSDVALDPSQFITVAVPEPAAFGLLAAATLIFPRCPRRLANGAARATTQHRSR